MPLRKTIATLALASLIVGCGGGTTMSAAPTAGPTAPQVTAAPSPTTAPAASVAATDAPAIDGLRVTFPSGDLTLGGMLWKPAGNGPFKAVLWNHGSEKGPGVDGSNPLLGPVFAAQGYVFFMPFRRGQGTSEGTYIDDALKAVPVAERPALLAELMTTEQLGDQLAGLDYLQALPYVDTTKIAVAGWSFGGIQTVLGAGDATAGYVAAVAFTPASQSWEGNADLQAALLAAARARPVPYLFIQAENDYSLVPTEELADAIAAIGGSAARKIYPAFGSTAQDGHEFAIRGSDTWGGEVFIFLADALGG